MSKEFKGTVLAFALFLVLGWFCSLPAKDAAVTIQSRHSYGSTFSLRSKTYEFLDKIGPIAKADDPDNRNVKESLRGLKDGDYLVLNLHSNARVFGYGGSSPSSEKESAPWNQFYQTFEVSDPPHLALVMVHGCIFNRNEEGEEVPASDAQIDAIRQALNADAIISFNTTINPQMATFSFQGLAKGMANRETIASMIKTPTLRFLVAPGIDRKSATLDSLQGRILGFEENTRTFGSPAGTITLDVPHVVYSGQSYTISGQISHDSYPKSNYHVNAGFAEEAKLMEAGSFKTKLINNLNGFDNQFSSQLDVPVTNEKYLKVQISVRSFAEGTSNRYGEIHVYKIPIRQ